MKVERVQRDGWAVVIPYLRQRSGFIAFKDDHPEGGWSILGRAFFCSRRAARTFAKALQATGYPNGRLRVVRVRATFHARRAT